MFSLNSFLLCCYILIKVCVSDQSLLCILILKKKNVVIWNGGSQSALYIDIYLLVVRILSMFCLLFNSVVWCDDFSSIHKYAYNK